jgi:hypothetical protein
MVKEDLDTLGCGRHVCSFRDKHAPVINEFLRIFLTDLILGR